MDPAVDKYLARYAEPEAALAKAVSGTYGAALIVPACRESIALLDGYTESASAAADRLLLILVVNGGLDAEPETHAANERLLAEIAERFPDAERLAGSGSGSLPPAQLAAGPDYDLLVVDRASSRYRLPDGQGVGLARRVGADIALGLCNQGRLRQSWLFGSDADAVLPRDYFSAVSAAVELRGESRTSALLYPFLHVPGGDAEVDRATALYEVSLRYYTLGLGWAGSPYAYHSIGSTFAVDAESYAKVRGFPKRLAGEDFYLLDKLAKIGPIQRLACEPVRIMSRRSDRVPFGTGRRVSEIAAANEAGTEYKLYHPEVFTALNLWLSALERFVNHRDVADLGRELRGARAGLGERAFQALSSLGSFEEVELSVRQSPRTAVLRRRVHTWFDALRTLRFIHALRDSGSVGLPFREALALAPFTPGVAEIEDPSEQASALARLEQGSPPLVGVSL